MMYQILKKLFLVLLCLSLLSSFVFAADYEVDGVVFSGDGIIGLSSSEECLEYFISCLAAQPSLLSDSGVPFSIGASYSYVSYTGPHNGSLDAVNSVGASSSGTLDFAINFKYDQLYFYPSNPGSASVTLSPVADNTVFSFMNPNLGDVSYSISGNTATVNINMSPEQYKTYQSLISDPSLQTVVALKVESATIDASSLSLGYSSYEAYEPIPPFSPPNATMQGLQGSRSALANSSRWETYNEYIGIQHVVMDLATTDLNGNEITGTANGDDLVSEAAAGIAYNGWSWSVDPDTGFLKFKSGAAAGSWLDMIFRYLTYDYYWGSRLWSGDVAGSWFGSISDNFSYLNYRVNQILDVLANDEDLAIKDATTPEREWVKGYFTGSGDKADADKYDKLNNTGSAFKDAFAGAPDSSIADGFTAVNDNGYDFWSQGVSDDINGNSSSSSGATRAPAYVPPEQRIVDAYSENWAQIVGGYYD